MTDEDGDAKLAELSRELPAIDLDQATAERIARRARAHVVRGPSPARLIEPALWVIVVAAYLIWAVIKVFEALR